MRVVIRTGTRRELHMTMDRDFENLIKLGTDGSMLALACDCEGACACAEQPIEFMVLPQKPGAVPEVRKVIDLKISGGETCC